MTIPNDTIVAAADGSRSRLFRNKAAEHAIDLEELPVADLETLNAGAGGLHRSSSAHPDRARLAEDGHVSSIAAYLNRNVLDGTFGRLVVIADPRTPGEMRKSFHAAATAILIGEIAKDLTGHSVDKIKHGLGEP